MEERLMNRVLRTHESKSNEMDQRWSVLLRRVLLLKPPNEGPKPVMSSLNSPDRLGGGFYKAHLLVDGHLSKDVLEITVIRKPLRCVEIWQRTVGQRFMPSRRILESMVRFARAFGQYGMEVRLHCPHGDDQSSLWVNFVHQRDRDAFAQELRDLLGICVNEDTRGLISFINAPLKAVQLAFDGSNPQVDEIAVIRDVTPSNIPWSAVSWVVLGGLLIGDEEEAVETLNGPSPLLPAIALGKQLKVTVTRHTRGQEMVSTLVTPFVLPSMKSMKHALSVLRSDVLACGVSIRYSSYKILGIPVATNETQWLSISVDIFRDGYLEFRLADDGRELKKKGGLFHRNEVSTTPPRFRLVKMSPIIQSDLKFKIQLLLTSLIDVDGSVHPIKVFIYEDDHEVFQAFYAILVVMQVKNHRIPDADIFRKYTENQFESYIASCFDSQSVKD
eukprot:GHVH01006900.1.p1 GENE.GHVH01006900.1~~GHVH01006900.1.p1  ORF type:complete len:445 (+),score=64.03 GHVH01006900.1:329-1663(+)